METKLSSIPSAEEAEKHLIASIQKFTSQPMAAAMRRMEAPLSFYSPEIDIEEVVILASRIGNGTNQPR